jgi:hypothetical protein
LRNGKITNEDLSTGITSGKPSAPRSGLMVDQRGGSIVHRHSTGANQETGRRIGRHLSALDQTGLHAQRELPGYGSKTMGQEMECPHRTLRTTVETLDPPAVEPPVLQPIGPELRPDKLSIDALRQLTPISLTAGLS